MRKRLHKSVLLALAVAGAAIVCGGCGPWDMAPPYTEKVSSHPDTYRAVFARGCPSLRPHVLRVWVFDYVPDPNIPPYVKVHQWHELNMDVHWEIVARRPIPAEGFQITVGQVPDGFEQVIPAGQPFVPEPGRQYSFGWETDWPCYQTYGADIALWAIRKGEHAKEH